MSNTARCANVALVATALAGACSAVAAAGPPAAESFASVSGTHFMALSPNGRLLAQDDLTQGVPRVIVWDVDTTKTARVVNLDPASKLRGLRWSDDQTLLVEASIQKAMECNASTRCKYEWERTMTVPMDGSAPKLLLMDDFKRQFATGALLLAPHSAKPGTVTMATWDYKFTRERDSTGSHIARSDRDKSGWTSVAFEVDTRTGEGRQIAAGTAYTEQWVVDREGQPVARAEWEPSRENFAVIVRDGSRWKTLYEQSHKGELELPGLTMDGKALVALGYVGSDKAKAWAIPIDGSPMTVLYEDPDSDVDVAMTDPYTNAVIGVHGSGADASAHWFDSERAFRQRSMNSAFPGRRVAFVDQSRNGQRAIVRVDSPSRPPTFHFVDFEKSRADIVGETYPALTNAALGAVKSIGYPARDGTRIPAFLTLPPGSSGKNVTLVVLPHGGPEWRDDGSFDFLAQFLATRGYAVLQPQFRGSTGQGEAFRKAGYRQWGGLMQDDVSDGVRHLIADGTADPQRICIVGASYGGYAALAGGAFTPDLYACVASIAGVSDLPAMLIETRRAMGSDSNSIAYWFDHIGPTSDPVIAAKSPARSASTMKAPVLLLHGVDDSVVPIDQSERMAKALQNAGKTVAFVRLQGEDHWLSRAETRLQVLKELEKFLAQYLR